MLLAQITEELLESQEVLEKSALDTINQHDKVATLINGLMMELDGMMSKLEAMNYTLEDTIATLNWEYPEERIQSLRDFSMMLEEQGMQLIRISQLTQTLMEEEETECEAIHAMETDIARHRDELEQLCQLDTE